MTTSPPTPDDLPPVTHLATTIIPCHTPQTAHLTPHTNSHTTLVDHLPLPTDHNAPPAAHRTTPPPPTIHTNTYPLQVNALTRRPDAKLKPRNGGIYVNDCGAWMNGPFTCMQPCARKASCNMLPCAALPAKYNLRAMLVEATLKVQPAAALYPHNAQSKHDPHS